MLASRLFSLPHTCAVRFIQSNLDKRKDARSSEKTALENAITTLKGTPVFQARALVLHHHAKRTFAERQLKADEMEVASHVIYYNSRKGARRDSRSWTVALQKQDATFRLRLAANVE